MIPQRGVVLVLVSLPYSAKEFGETFYPALIFPSHQRDPWPTGLSLLVQLPEISALTPLLFLSPEILESVLKPG